MQFRTQTIALIATLAAAVPVLAHSGPRIFLGNDGGKVGTYLGNSGESSTTFTPDRVFTTTLTNTITPTLYTNQFPGYQVAEGKGVAGGTTFALTVAGPLLVFEDYNGSTGIYRTVAEAFSGSTVPQVSVSRNLESRVTSTGALAPIDVLAYNGPGDHGHATYTFFGDGTTASNGPAGVYALPLTVAGNGLAASSTFYLLLGKDVAAGSAEMIAAEAVARATLVPEPATLAACAIAGAMLIRRRRA